MDITIGKTVGNTAIIFIVEIRKEVPVNIPETRLLILNIILLHKLSKPFIQLE